MRSQGRWWAGLPAVLLVAALAVAGCGGGSSDDGNSSKPIVVGTSLPLTGEDSQLGVAVQQGYKAWEKDVNAAGGILGRKVQVKILDDNDNQNTIISDYNALISKDKVDFVVGTFSSRLTLPAQAVARRHQMLYLNPAGGAREVFEQGNDLLFYTEPSPPWNFGVPFAKYIASLPAGQRPKTVAYVITQDPFTSTSAEGMKPVIKQAGIKTVLSATYPFGARNFDPIAAQVKESGAEMVVDVGGFPDETGLARAMIKAGAAPKILYQVNAPSLTADYLKAMGKPSTEGVFFPVGYTPQLKTTGNAQFVKTFKALYPKEEPSGLGAFAYGSGQVLKAVVEAVGEKGIANQQLLADWLHANSVGTVSGDLSWDAKGISQGQFVLSQWQGGSPKVILPKDLAESDTILQCWRTC